MEGVHLQGRAKVCSRGSAKYPRIVFVLVDHSPWAETLMNVRKSDLVCNQWQLSDRNHVCAHHTPLALRHPPLNLLTLNLLTFVCLSLSLGRRYFVNTTTNQTTWALPEGFKDEGGHELVKSEGGSPGAAEASASSKKKKAPKESAVEMATLPR